MPDKISHKGNITQNVKININNSGNKKTSKRRPNVRNPQRLDPSLGFGGGSGSSFAIPPIIHNDNKPDITDLENTLDKVYNNQMTQHTYTNYIKDGYQHHPQVFPSHFTFQLGDREKLPALPAPEDRFEEIESTPPPSPSHSAPSLSFGGGSGSGGGTPMASGGGAPPTATPFKKSYKSRKDMTGMTNLGIKSRILRDVAHIHHYEGEHKEKLLRNIKGDIQELNKRSGKDYKDLLPIEYH